MRRNLSECSAILIRTEYTAWTTTRELNDRVWEYGEKLGQRERRYLQDRAGTQLRQTLAVRRRQAPDIHLASITHGKPLPLFGNAHLPLIAILIGSGQGVVIGLGKFRVQGAEFLVGADGSFRGRGGPAALGGGQVGLRLGGRGQRRGGQD